jgi:PAS domain S-box-containing protein
VDEFDTVASPSELIGCGTDMRTNSDKANNTDAKNTQESARTQSNAQEPIPPSPHDPHLGAESLRTGEGLPAPETEDILPSDQTNLVGHLRAAQERAEVAEQSLHQREAIFAAVADALVIYDETGHLMEWNAAVATLFEFDRMTGFPELPVDVRAGNLNVCDEQGRPIAPENLPVMRAIHGETLTGAHSVDLTITTPSGRIKNVSASASPLRDTHGQIVGAVALFRDVTERRTLERQARWQASMLEQAHDTIFMWELGGPIVYWNAGAEQTYGFTKEEAIGQISHDLLRTLHPIARSDFEQMLASVGEWTGELTHTTRDGRQVVVLSRQQLMPEASGRCYVLETSRDITERKQLEVRTREALDALLAMAETLVLSPNDALQTNDALQSGASSRSEAVKDPSHGRRSAVAQRLASLTCEVLGCRRVGITLVDPDTRLLHAVAVVGLLPDQERQWWIEQEEAEQRGVRFGDGPDGASGTDAAQREQLAYFEAGGIIMLDLTRPPYDAIPNPYGVTTSLFAPMRVESSLVGILSLDYGGPPHTFTTDEQELAGALAKVAALVLERERLLRETMAARARAFGAEEAQRRQEDFLNLVTHELLTPLTGLQLTLQLALRRAAQLSPEVQRPTQLLTLLERSDGQAARLRRMVNDLVDAARIQVNKLVVVPTHQPLAELLALVRDRSEELKHAHPTRAIQVQMLSVVAVESLFIDMDNDRIGQVLTNYLTNAARYSSEDRPIAVTVRVEAHQVRVEVQDEGPGLSAQDQTQIWERFHQAADVVAHGSGGVGLGLGLHISRSLVERHGGRVGVSSKKGRGSTFWFSLPLSQDQSSP